MFGDIDIIWTWQKASANINQQLPALKTEANSAMRNACLQYFSSAAFCFFSLKSNEPRILIPYLEMSLQLVFISAGNTATQS